MKFTGLNPNPIEGCCPRYCPHGHRCALTPEFVDGKITNQPSQAKLLYRQERIKKGLIPYVFRCEPAFENGGNLTPEVKRLQFLCSGNPCGNPRGQAGNH